MPHGAGTGLLSAHYLDPRDAESRVLTQGRDGRLIVWDPAVLFAAGDTSPTPGLPLAVVVQHSLAHTLQREQAAQRTRSPMGPPLHVCGTESYSFCR